MKTKIVTSKSSNLLNTKSLYLMLMASFLLVLSCDKKDVGVATNENALVFNSPPANIEDAYQQTFSMYDYKIKPEAIGTFSQGVSMINDPDTRQTYELITKNGIMDRLFTTPTKNGRVSGEKTLNVEEVNKIINSKDVSKHTRKHLLTFSKGMEKIKSKISDESYDADKAILNELEQLEKNTNKDSELNATEKLTFATITQTLTKNYNDIKKSAEKAQAGRKTNCWICAVFNAVVTVVLVAVVVAVAVVTVAAAAVMAATGAAISAAAATVAIVIGAGLGSIGGIVMVAYNFCFVLIDYGQFTSGTNIQGVWFGPC